MPKKTGQSRPRSSSPWKKAIRITLIIVFFLSAALFAAGSGFFFLKVLPDAAKKVQNLPELVQQSRGEPTTIVSSDGKVLLRLAIEYRKEVDFNDIPETVIKTTLAAEDIRFFDHKGVDLIALGRIIRESFTKTRTTGGSTLTMQLAKLMYTSPDRDFFRKLNDIALAIQMEKLLTKEQILEFYLNTVYYGDGAFGVGAAADVYFGKKLKDLTLSEAALLSRCVRVPSKENPRTDFETAINNRNVVLKVMKDEGLITNDEYSKAISEKIRLSEERVHLDGTSGKVSPYFVDYVLRQVKRVLPGVDIKQGGYRIETTLNQELQAQVEKEMNRTIRDYRTIRTGGAIVLDRVGRIRAMFGGPSYKEDQYNGATQGRRQPGSSFKPFVYLVAAQNGIVRSAGSTVDNSTVEFTENGRVHRPKGGGPNGGVSLKSALAYSYNRAAWHTLEKVGPGTLVRHAHQDLGFVSELPAVPSLALGSGSVSPLEMAQAYTVFLLRGRRADAYGIERIIGPNGMPVYADPQAIHQTSFGERATDVIDECLRAVVTSGTGRAAGGVRNARGKTGTTNDNRDAWFCGYTDQYVAAVWFSNPIKKGKTKSYEEMGPAVMGGKVGAPTWASIMRDVQRILGEEESGDRRSSPDEEVDPDEAARRERSPDPDDKVEPIKAPEPPKDTTKPKTDPTAPEGDPASNPNAASPTGAGGQDPPKTQPPTTRPDEGTKPETVTVEICADSGQRATVYCPERISRTFTKGREPKGRCPLNHRN